MSHTASRSMPDASTRFADWLGEMALGGVGQPDWLTQERQAARARLDHQGVPTGKSEGWRYTGLQGLMEQSFRAPASAEEFEANSPDAALLTPHLVPGLDAHRVVIRNGRFDAALSNIGELPSGVRVTSLVQTLAESPERIQPLLTQVAGEGAHLFASLNTAGMSDGLVLLLDAGVVLERPLEVIHLSQGSARQDGTQPHVFQPRHLIALGEGAEATLIERYVGEHDALYCTNSVLELHLDRSARLHHQRVQLESRNAFHITGLYLRQAAESHYSGVNLGLGGAWARTDLMTRFIGEHAECALQGLYLAGDKQLIDYHMDVRHDLPNCSSRENFKGIVHGKGRAVFDGLVYVARDAQKTDAEMSNRNLMLSRNAEIDTKPQLEIYADDVKCSHGTTVGQIEPEMLFYLRSRGIPLATARRMLCLGFAGEIIDAVTEPALRAYLTEVVGQRLESAAL